MTEFSISDVGVRVGLEIHQQLATGRKLFCSCAPVESEEHPIRFRRRLRATKSELGRYDPAALFEGTKSKTIEYLANPESSCLVEQDEEPPHELDCEARRIVLMVATALKSSVFEEIYPMRKTVVDGSNTTGFQRTMLVSQGGYYDAGPRKIGVQSICLEEDAAKILDGKGDVKRYGLERLGIPLVEIATEPFEAEPGQVREIALSLGRILRSTRKVRRGLGSIRQDVNVSVRNGGAVIEVKGVQQLDQLEGVVEYEARRQHGLLVISSRMRDAGWPHGPEAEADATGLLAGCGSKIIAGAVKKGQRIHAVLFRNMAGMFGYSPYDGIRLGREVAEMVRFFGIGGIFHSDELPAYGIAESDVDGIRNLLNAGSGDAFLILAAPENMIRTVMDHIIQRITNIRDHGVPADTRLAMPDGTTRFLRPKPGAARMYPETDIPPITVTQDELEEVRKSAPKSWDESVMDLQKKHGINAQLAEQVYDSEYLELFEGIADGTNVSPTFVASVLCSVITGLERSGLDSSLLGSGEIVKIFEMLDQGRIAKESVEIIFEDIMSGRSKTAQEAMRNKTIEAVDESELSDIIRRILEGNRDMIGRQKERAIGPLMGIAMKELRGKASGQTINALLARGIKDMLD